jgi:CHASE2 domain-containing sensor protein
MEYAMTKQKKIATKIAGGTKIARKKQRTVIAGATQAGATGSAAAPTRGATLDQISSWIGWQAHSVRGAMSGALKKKQGLAITSDKAKEGQRVYRIAA